MELTIYDFVTLFLVVPLLFFKFTYIPEWLIEQARKSNKTVLLVVLAIVLTAIAAFVAANLTQGMAVRCIAFMIAVVACVLHYLYTKENPASESKAENSKQ